MTRRLAVMAVAVAMVALLCCSIGASASSLASVHRLASHAIVETALLELAEQQGFTFTEDQAMHESARDEEIVTYSRVDADGGVSSVTFRTNEPTTASSGDSSLAGLATEDSSFLATSSRVGGACAKPLCQTSGPWQAKCLESVCYPLCLGSVFDVSVVGAGDAEDFVEQLAEPAHQTAIQGVLLGIGCSEHTGCCPKDARLAQWTESKMGGPKMFGLPLPYCMHAGDREKACAACQATVTVTPKGAETCENFFKPFDVTTASESFGRSAGATPIKPAHKSMKEKCLAVNAEVSGAAGAMQAAFQGYICGCLGCCDDQVCPYQLAHVSVGAALASDAAAAAAAADGDDAAGGDDADGADGADGDDAADGDAADGADGADGDDAAGGDDAAAGGDGADAGAAAGGGGLGGLSSKMGGLSSKLSGAMSKLSGAGGGALSGKLAGLKSKAMGAVGGLKGKLAGAMSQAKGQMAGLQSKLGGAMDKAGLGKYKGQLDGAFAKAGGKMDELQQQADGAADQATSALGGSDAGGDAATEDE